MSENLITCKEVLKILGLRTPAYVGYLVQRRLLPRIEIGPRSFRYEKQDVENLLELSKTQGVLLTVIPKKNKN
jgi:predicted DNA-binding transcriptional regulator AlpA